MSKFKDYFNSGKTAPADESSTIDNPEELETAEYQQARTGLFHISRNTLMIFSAVVVLICVLALLLIPVPYVIEGPGPAYNILGPSVSGKDQSEDYDPSNTHSDNPMLTIKGRKTYPVSGQLDMTVVRVGGGPGRSINFLEVAEAFFNPEKAVVPEEEVFDPSLNQDQVDQQNAQMFSSSQDYAVAAASQQLGIKYSSAVKVSSILENSPASDKLREGDEILAVNGEKIKSREQVIKIVNASGGKNPAQGQEGKTLDFRIKRGSKEQTVAVTPVYEPKTSQAPAGFRVGMTLDVDYTFPYEVDFSAEDIGGPSAGLMFSLSVIDKLTFEDLTQGKHIAGTGSISENGQVGSIGGIKQKMIGAKKSGATLFLAPKDNCDEVVDNIPEGLDVVAVENLQQARSSIESYTKNGNISGLTQCSTQ